MSEPSPRASAGPQIARSFLFLPADRLERLSKALDSGAHAVVVDLEDAVVPAHKTAARQALADHWAALSPAARSRLLVRFNAAHTPWHDDDIAQLQALSGLGGVMLSKAEAKADLDHVTAALPALALVPLIESAEGFGTLDTIARARGVSRLAFGHLDFQLDLGLACDADEAELASVRLALVLASRRAGLAAPIDGVTTALQDPDRLEQDCQRARRFGFGAKLCIHPTQVEVVNRVLGPSVDERAWAQRVLEAARLQGDGAFRFEGAMVDTPVLARARRYASDA